MSSELTDYRIEPGPGSRNPWQPPGSAAGVSVSLHRYPGMIHGFFQMTGALPGARPLHHDRAAQIRAQAPSSP